jgi:hypothetical protein
MCDQPTFRDRGITHVLVLGYFSSLKILKTVQLRIPTQARRGDALSRPRRVSDVSFFCCSGRDCSCDVSPAHTRLITIGTNPGFMLPVDCCLSPIAY